MLAIMFLMSRSLMIESMPATIQAGTVAVELMSAEEPVWMTWKLNPLKT